MLWFYLQMMSSMDATEIAMEDILSSKSSASTSPIAKACNCDERPMSSSLDPNAESMGQANGSPTTATPINLGLAFALQRKRVARAVQKLAEKAHIPMPLTQVGPLCCFLVELNVHSKCSNSVPLT
jgi:hypothetical protein